MQLFQGVHRCSHHDRECYVRAHRVHQFRRGALHPGGEYRHAALPARAEGYKNFQLVKFWQTEINIGRIGVIRFDLESGA